MKNDITLVFPYYNASNLIPLQLECWNSYTEDVKNNLKIIIVDDGSNATNKLVNVLPKNTGFNIEIYEVTEDIPWNSEGASNLGIHVAKTKWVLRTDIDYLIPKEVMDYVFNTDLDENSYYTFNAKYYHTKENIAVHDNTFLVPKDLFFKAGGYDEDFTGNHGYTDILMLLNLDKIATHIRLNNLYIEGVLGGSIHTLKRNESINRELFKNKIRDKEGKPSDLMRFPWRKVEF